MCAHVLAAVSGHGYGHVSQTAAVVGELRAHHPGLRITVQTAAAAAVVHARFGADIALIPSAPDVGMLMHSPLDVDGPGTHAAYAAFHHRWDARIDTEARLLERLAPDLILANVPYLTLAAAHRVGIPAVALCSLNWVDIFTHYCGHVAGAVPIVNQMRAAYALARRFYVPEPGMPAAHLAPARPVGVIGRRGTRLDARLRQEFGVGTDERILLLALGGVDLVLALERWPDLPGWRLAAPAALAARRRGSLALGPHYTGDRFTDLLCSCDAVLTKPGYGTFAEIAGNAVPALYVRRPDWPEEPYLVRWLRDRARCGEIPRALFEHGHLGAALAALLAQPPRAAVPLDGAAEVALDLTREFLAPAA